MSIRYKDFKIENKKQPNLKIGKGYQQANYQTRNAK